MEDQTILVVGATGALGGRGCSENDNGAGLSGPVASRSGATEQSSKTPRHCSLSWQRSMSQTVSRTAEIREN
jgi:hypothetical protein